MKAWSEIQEEVIEACKQSGDLDTLLAKVSQARNQYTTYDSLQKVWKRWGLPSITEVLGTNIRFTVPKDVVPPKEPDSTYYVNQKTPASLTIIPDIHFPTHSPTALAAVIAFLRDIKPERVVQLGDAYDMYSISSFPRAPERVFSFGATIHQEVQSAKEFWTELLGISKSVDFLPGNHEQRIERLIQANIGLFGHPNFELRSILEIPEAIVVHDYGAKLRIGNCVITHGDRLLNVKGAPIYLAKKVLEKYPHQNTFLGHFHTIDIRRSVTYDVYDQAATHMAACIGHLSDTKKQTYISDPNWMHGFAHLEFWQEGGKDRFTVHIIEIVNGSFMFAGQKYDGRRLM